MFNHHALLNILGDYLINERNDFRIYPRFSKKPLKEETSGFLRGIFRLDKPALSILPQFPYMRITFSQFIIYNIATFKRKDHGLRGRLTRRKINHSFLTITD